MATGFVDRWKGKITVDAAAQWVQGQPLYGAASVQTISTAASATFPNTTAVDGSSATNFGVSIVKSSATSVITMRAPSYAGQFKLVQISTLNTAANIFLKVSTGGGVTLNGSSFSVIQSTIGNSILEFVATSTVNWAFAGLNNSTATHALTTTT